jgi:hypothetical protein
MKKLLTLIMFYITLTSLAAAPTISAETLISQGKNIINNFADQKTVAEALSQLKAGISFVTPGITELLNKLKISSAETSEKALIAPYAQDSKTNAVANWNKKFEENKAEYSAPEQLSALQDISAQLSGIASNQPATEELHNLLVNAFASK